jgi:hypothetical protein
MDRQWVGLPSTAEEGLDDLPQTSDRRGGPHPGLRRRECGCRRGRQGTETGDDQGQAEDRHEAQSPSAPVRIERSADGTHFTSEATTTPTTGGDWHATVNVRATADYRATSGPDASEIRRLLVSSSRVKVHATRAGVAVRVTPKAPYGRLMLQRRLRERFGWWPIARKRLDYLSKARFRVRRPARVRAVLIDTEVGHPSRSAASSTSGARASTA